MSFDSFILTQSANLRQSYYLIRKHKTEEEEYYDTLSDEQKQILADIGMVIRASDYQTAYELQSSAEFHDLCNYNQD